MFIAWAPPWLFASFIVVVTTIALAEYFAMALPEHMPERVTGIILGLLVAAGVATRDPNVWGAGVSVTVVVGLGFLLLHHDDLAAAVHRFGLQVVGVLYVGFTPHMTLMREIPSGEGWKWVLFTLGAVFGSDSGGYFAGRAYGRRKLAPQVSPSKTVEGAAGAVVTAVLGALLMNLLVGLGLGAGGAAFLGMTMSALAQFGDLCESALKRARREGLRLDYPRARWHLGSAGQPAVPVRVRLLLRGRRGSLRSRCRSPSPSSPWPPSCSRWASSCSSTSSGTSSRPSGSTSRCCASRSASARSSGAGSAARPSTRSP
jgi:phosphatidate cytidylyltransferase